LYQRDKTVLQMLTVIAALSWCMNILAAVFNYCFVFFFDLHA